MGVKEAAQAAEVHYTSVYEWKRQLEALGEEGFLAYRASDAGTGSEADLGPEGRSGSDHLETLPGFWSGAGEEPASSAGGDGFDPNGASADGGQRV